MDTVEHLIVGGGPAGLRAAQVLADAGREVLLVEKRPEIGPKVCAGGLTPKAARLLEKLGLPRDLGLTSVGHIGFNGGRAGVLDPAQTAVRTLPRRQLGRIQLGWTLAAGAEVRTGVAVTEIDLETRRARIGPVALQWRHLVGADGADSAVRRGSGSLRRGRTSPRSTTSRAGSSRRSGWNAIPIGSAVATSGSSRTSATPRSEPSQRNDRCRRPCSARYLDRQMEALGLAGASTPFEGATLEVECRGFHFPGGVHLAGDAAGVPSALTAEGIYSALVTGEEVARTILDPGYPISATPQRWLRVKRRHDRLARVLGSAARPPSRLPHPRRDGPLASSPPSHGEMVPRRLKPRPV